MPQPTPDTTSRAERARPAERLVVWVAPAGAPEVERAAEGLAGGVDLAIVDAGALAEQLADGGPDVLVVGGADALALCRLASPAIPTLVIGAPLADAYAAGAGDALGPAFERDELALRVAALARARRTHDEALAEVRRESARLEARLAGELAAGVAHARSEAGLDLLARAGEVLMSSLDARAHVGGLALLAVPLLGDLCAVFLTDDDGVARLVEACALDPRQVAHLRERVGPSGGDFPVVAGVIREGRSMLLPRITDAELQAVARSGEHLEELRSYGVHSFLCVPISVRRRPLGALAFGRSGEAPGYDDDDRELAEELARRAAMALESSRAFDLAEREWRRAEEANQLKDEFLANLSHELRTPLSAVLGWIRILRTRVLPEDKRAQALESIERNAAAQARLVEDLLDVSRIIAGKLTLEAHAVDLAVVIETALEAVRPSAEQRRLSLRSEIDGSASSLVGDAERLRQVVSNILSNAVKFTPPGGAVEVRLDREGDDARISVTDTGQGIGHDFLPFVFERFRQADGGVKRVHGGLGIGLAIARHLVEAHRGTIEVRSPGPDQGSTFTVRLPLDHDGGAPHTPASGDRDGGDPHTPASGDRDGGDPHTPASGDRDGGRTSMPPAEG